MKSNQLDGINEPMLGFPDTDGTGLIQVLKGMTMEEIELSAIHLGLQRNHGNKSKTAEELGISVRTIYRKLDQS